jgi:DNA repair ATPase RecN
MNNQRILIAAVAVLVIVCGVLAYKLTQKTDVIEVIEEEKVALTDERDALLKDLEELQFSYDTLKTENEVMLAEIADQRDQIEKLMKRVRGKNGSLSKAKKEAETLRTIMKGYVATIDSLNQLNQQLMAENEGIRAEMQEVQTRNQELFIRQENMEGMISTGKILTAAGLSAQPLELVNSGRQRETKRANRTDMVRVCFTLLENRIADKGKRTVYLQIVDAAGKVLSSDSEASVETPGGTPVSVSRGLDYTRERLDACIFFQPAVELAEGTYKAYILDGDNRIGSVDFTLR